MVRSVLIALWGCAGAAPPAPLEAELAPAAASAPAVAAELPAAPAPSSTSAPPAPLGGGELAESCEPSALIRVGDRWVVGDNEGAERLYVYDDAMRLVEHIPLPTPVDDIEALALDGDALIVVGSHSNNKEGKARPERHRILRLDDGTSFALKLEGCAPCQAAAALAPNAGGFNIEGAVVRGEELLVALRAPAAADSALLLHTPLRGPAAGTISKLEFVPLGPGLGFRDLMPLGDGQLLIVQGSTVDSPALHGARSWAGPGTPPGAHVVELPNGTEGAALVAPGRLRYVIDGDGKPGKCKAAGRWGEVAFY